MADIRIRTAVADDAAAIADVYNHYIRTSTATFDTVEKSVEERKEWLAARGPGHPVLVAENTAGRVVGWGALSPWSPRPAWGTTCEVAVYLEPDSCGQGRGRVLLGRLLDEAVALGHHVLIAQIVGENAASIALFERAGFERAGTLKEVGCKFDRRLDVVLMQVVLREGRE